MHGNICVSVMLILSEPVGQPEEQDLHDWQRFSVHCQANIAEKMSSCVIRKCLKLPSYITKLSQLVPWFGQYVNTHSLAFFSWYLGNTHCVKKMVAKALMVIEFRIHILNSSLSVK